MEEAHPLLLICCAQIRPCSPYIVLLTDQSSSSACTFCARTPIDEPSVQSINRAELNMEGKTAYLGVGVDAILSHQPQRQNKTKVRGGHSIAPARPGNVPPM